MTILEGSRFGHYEVIARLGAGAMAEVYRARDLTLGRQVALKVLPAQVLTDPSRLARFRQEASAASSLNHPNIVTVYEIGQVDELTYIALELVEGKTLRELLTGTPLGTLTVVRLAEQIAEGLAKAHGATIVHRDLKPENVMVTDDELVKILDFGIAKFAQPASSDDTTDLVAASQVQTGSGIVLGTVTYMSPEQARGQTVDFRSDQFALGVMLYEMTTGRHPFRSQSTAETLSAIIRDTPPPVAALNAGTPAPLCWIIDRCLAKDPDDRYASTRDLARDLEAIAQHLSNPSGSVFAAPRPRAKRKIIDSLAVLPLVNASGDADADYLGDGITERIINELSRLRKLKVMARSTVFRYKDRAEDPQRVGLDLRVDAVVTGRVVLRGDTLTVSAELVDVGEGSQLWGAQYTRKVDDISSLHEEISNEIATRLRGRRSAAKPARPARPATTSGEAYQLYLRGRFFWNKRTPEGIKRGIEYLQRAIDTDPLFALAHAGLADCYSVLAASEFAIFPPRQIMPRAKAAATQAVEIDDGLAEAHCALASIKFWYDWDWPGAERGFKRALDLNPGYAAAHTWYGEFLSAMERPQEALAECRRSVDLDPLSVTALWSLGRVLLITHEYDLAIEEMHKALEIDPTFMRPYYVLAWAYYKVGRPEEGIASIQKSIAIGGENPFKKGYLGHLYAITGKPDEARRILEELAAQSALRYVSGFYRAIVHCGLGEADQAFTYLDQAVDERSGWLPYAKVGAFLDPLRDDPRFGDLLRRIGLPS